MRNIAFAPGEYYHIYNRGTDKREIVSDKEDSERFIKSMKLFNARKPIGSIYELSFDNLWKMGHRTRDGGKLVEFVAYCLNPNHYHLLVRENMDGGISEFMKRLGGGYTGYYNTKHKRSGVLFQGKFKAKHITTDGYLTHLSVYINLNDRAHQLGGPTAKLVRSSWDEYCGNMRDTRFGEICTGKGVVLNQFKDKKAYDIFAKTSLRDIVTNKKAKRLEEELEKLLLE